MPKVTPALPRVLSALIGEKAILFAISVNALALFTLALVSPDSTAARVASVVDYACVVLFLAEAAIKIGLERRRYFASAWNRFDFAVVVLSLPVLLSPWIDLQAFAAVLLLRLGRLFRLFHLFHFIPNVDRMMSGVRRSLRASVGVLIALCILLFILSLGAHFLFGQFAPEHFGDPFIAIYSVFRVFTVEGWYELPDAIAQSADSTAWGVVARVYFMGAVLGGGIIGLSLANAIFVDEMTMDNNDDLTARVVELSNEIAELKALLVESRQASGVAAPGADGNSAPVDSSVVPASRGVSGV